MPKYEWNEEKNEWLKENRGLGFEEVVKAIIEGRVLKITPHRNQIKYPGQQLLHISIGNYAYTVPYVKSGNKVFLKTMYASRKATKKIFGSKK